MESFTPYSALAGGALIGAAATLLRFWKGGSTSRVRARSISG